MSHSLTINSAATWLSTVPLLLLSPEKSSELMKNKEAQRYIASKLIEYFSESQASLTNSIVSILENAEEPGKHIMVTILLQSTSLWNDLVQNERLRAALTALALTPDKIFTKNAIKLSKNLEDLTITSTQQELSKDEVPLVKIERPASFPSPKPSVGGISKPEEAQPIVERVRKKEVAPSDERSISISEMRKEVAPELKKSPPAPAPPPPSLAAMTAEAAPEEPPVMENEMEEDFGVILDEPLAIDDSLDEAKVEAKKKKKSVARQAFEPIETPSPAEKPERIFTHLHYFNRMNSRKTYPFTVSLSKEARKVRKRTMHILSGERETEKQAEFELDKLTRQIMVELLISGCLVQPTFQYVDPENLPVELTFYITPLIEAGFQSSKVDGKLMIRDELGGILQSLPLFDISVVSTRISKIAALIGTLGGMAVPVLDFFGWGIQDALTGQLTESVPGLASSINIRELISIGQIAIFIFFIGLALVWWRWKGRSRRAPREKLSLNIPRLT